ncbi:MAG: hypothetical protein ACE5EX_12010 [Phycisphaerae bacterium]
MMKTLVRVVAISIVLACLGASLALATQVVRRSPQELGKQSSLVVRGKVTGVRSFWNDKHTKIFTETQIAVDQSYKGAPPGVIRVLQLGGIVDNVKVTVAGALQWRPEEEVLLFLEPYDKGAYQVSGFSQGKFSIVRDPLTNQPYVERPALEDVQLVGGSAPNGLQRTSKVDRVPLERFVNQALGRGK